MASCLIIILGNRKKKKKKLPSLVLDKEYEKDVPLKLARKR